MLKSFSKLLNKEKDRKQYWKAIYWCTFECDKSTANSFLSSNSMQTGCGLWTINYGNHFVVIYYSSFPDLKGLNIVFFCSYIWKQLNGTLCWTSACWVKVCVECKHTCNIKLILRSCHWELFQTNLLFYIRMQRVTLYQIDQYSWWNEERTIPIGICYENFSTQISRRWTFTASDLSCISRLMIKYGFRCNFLK